MQRSYLLKFYGTQETLNGMNYGCKTLCQIKKGVENGRDDRALEPFVLLCDQAPFVFKDEAN